MCVKCDDGDATKVSHREVSIKTLRKVEEVKADIRSNGENVKMVEWWVTPELYIAYVTFTYFDGYAYTEDFVQVIVER